MNNLPTLPRRLLAALPRAWAADRVFRLAVIGAGLALVVLLLRLGAGESTNGDGAPSAARIPLPPPGTRYEAPVSDELASPVPGTPLAPGRGLEGVTIVRNPDAATDPFGTLRAGEPPRAPSRKDP
ncbi:hypothetical protein [Amaricoccus sp. W119]|uniref:hypothetical protein n=1 Tax=Amaricoccus sp. W119 TaxID=3391833 RepID=UPI0039A65FAA